MIAAYGICFGGTFAAKSVIARRAPAAAPPLARKLALRGVGAMPKEDYEPVRTASGGVWPPVEEERGAAASSSGVPRWAAPPAPAPPSAPLAIFSADGDDDPLEQPLVSGAEEPPPPPSPPWFCLLAFFVCSCLFLLEIRTNGWEFQPFVCPYECEGTSAGNGTRWLFPCYEDGTRCEGNPLLGPKAEVMDQLGAKNDEAMFVRHEWWRVLSCNWLHAGLIHLGFNMLGLKNLGVPLERRFGFKRTALLYVVSGLFGTMVSVIFLPGTISVGASASVFGLLGAVWADVIQNQCTRCVSPLQHQCNRGSVSRHPWTAAWFTSVTLVCHEPTFLMRQVRRAPRRARLPCGDDRAQLLPRPDPDDR